MCNWNCHCKRPHLPEQTGTQYPHVYSQSYVVSGMCGIAILNGTPCWPYRVERVTTECSHARAILRPSHSAEKIFLLNVTVVILFSSDAPSVLGMLARASQGHKPERKRYPSFLNTCNDPYPHSSRSLPSIHACHARSTYIHNVCVFGEATFTYTTMQCLTAA